MENIGDLRANMLLAYEPASIADCMIQESCSPPPPSCELMLAAVCEHAEDRKPFASLQCPRLNSDPGRNISVNDNRDAVSVPG